jgi:nucleoside phosphorylase
LSVQPGLDASGNPILYYMYEVEPQAIHSDASAPYKGAAILRYYGHGEELSGNYWTSQRTSGRFKLLRKPDPAEATMNDITDVLLITALTEEYNAARQTFSANELEGDGVRSWAKLEAASNLPHERGVFYHQGAALFSISIARPSRMGGIEMGQFAGRLAERLQPNCMVMCGVCAGNPKDVALGDVVVSELAFQYDEGKLESEGFIGDYRQSLVSEAWQRAAEALRPETLPSFGRPSPRDARYWLLERLQAGDEPKEHPARTRYFAKGEWAAMIDQLLLEKIIEIDGTSLNLTPAGVAEVEHSLLRDVDPPGQLPFAIKVGPIASGNVVVKDGITWESLKHMGVRSVIGLEMEAAAIGRTARASAVPEWIVVKGVMDHADPRKDDRYKPFAARASSEVLRAFLVDRFVSGFSSRLDLSSL